MRMLPSPRAGLRRLAIILGAAAAFSVALTLTSEEARPNDRLELLRRDAGISAAPTADRRGRRALRPQGLSGAVPPQPRPQRSQPGSVCRCGWHLPSARSRAAVAMD